MNYEAMEIKELYGLEALGAGLKRAIQQEVGKAAKEEGGSRKRKSVGRKDKRRREWVERKKRRKGEEVKGKGMKRNCSGIKWEMERKNVLLPIRFFT